MPPPGRPPYLYPAHLETLVKDGTSLHVRPILPGDAHLLEVFHQTLSSDAIHRRYLAPHPILTPGELFRLTNVDYVDRLALVVLDEGSMVAIARYDRITYATAEVAFIVTDDHQRTGLATTLFSLLADAAREVGITHFVAETLTTNSAMLAVLLHSGYETTTRALTSEVEVCVDITSPQKNSDPE